MSTLDWVAAKDYQEIKYEKAEGIAKITINRPERRNAFTPLTVDEMRDALDDARMSGDIGVIILTGEGEKAVAVLGRGLKVHPVRCTLHFLAQFLNRLVDIQRGYVVFLFLRGN